jgi:hypothetical protein
MRMTMSVEHDTNFVSGIEQEMIEITNFVPEKKYRKRQDYLAALLRAVCDLSDEDFDKLSDEAAEWSIKAVDAHKAGEALPDPENDEEHESEHEQRNVGDHEVVHTSGESEISPDNAGSDNEGNETETKEKPAPKKRGRPKGSVSKAKGKAAKAKKEPRGRKGRVSPRGNNQWGVTNSTKSDLVCRMLAQEGGTTMKDIMEATGHAHYNLVNRLRRHGHTIIKDGLNIRLVTQNKD